MPRNLADGMATPNAIRKPPPVYTPNARPALNSFGGPYGTNIGSAANPFPAMSVANAGKAQPSPIRQVSAPKAAKTNTTYRAPTSSGSSGGGGGGSSSGGGGGGGGGPVGGSGGLGTTLASAAAMAPPPPIMETIDIPDAKTDDNYQKTIADLARAKGDFDATQGLQRSQYDRSFGEAKTRMGYRPGQDGKEGWSLDPMQGAYGEANYANDNDFAGRGILRSGMYAQAKTDVANNFTDRLNQLVSARTDNVDTANRAKESFMGQQDATDKAALTDAVNRIAAKYALAIGDVPMGTGGKQITREKVG